MTGQFEFQVTTQIIYSRNSSRSLGEIVSRFGIKRYQLVTDAGVAGAGILEGLLESLKVAGIDTVLFDEVEFNPTVQTMGILDPVDPFELSHKKSAFGFI